MAVTAAAFTLTQPTPTTRDGALLVRAAAAGDEAAFAALYDRYARSVYNMILRSVRDQHEAEDLSQDVWVKAHSQLKRLREPAAFPAWIYRIAAKTCIDAARRRRRTPDTTCLPEDMAAVRSDPEQRAVERDSSLLVWEALPGLPAHQHLALFLREVEHRSYREISHVLRISETAVGLCLLRGRRGFMKEYGRLERGGPHDRCLKAERIMSLRIDGESTVIQDRVLDEHLETCASCRGQYESLRQASRQYARLGLAPVPLLLSTKVFGAAGLAAKGAAGGAFAKLTATIAALLKPLLASAAVVAVVGGGAMLAPRATAVLTADNSSAHAGAATPPHTTAPAAATASGISPGAVPAPQGAASPRAAASETMSAAPAGTPPPAAADAPGTVVATTQALAATLTGAAHSVVDAVPVAVPVTSPATSLLGGPAIPAAQISAPHVGAPVTASVNGVVGASVSVP